MLTGLKIGAPRLRGKKNLFVFRSIARAKFGGFLLMPLTATTGVLFLDAYIIVALPAFVLLVTGAVVAYSAAESQVSAERRRQVCDSLSHCFGRRSR